jgi:hypothetical protein
MDDQVARILSDKLNRDATNRNNAKQNEFNRKLNELQQMTETLQSQISELKNSIGKKNGSGLSMETFWVKVVFSGIFCLAALFVVLSNKYDETTKKWALNVLVGIAGVWIGTIS